MKLKEKYLAVTLCLVFVAENRTGNCVKKTDPHSWIWMWNTREHDWGSDPASSSFAAATSNAIIYDLICLKDGLKAIINSYERG